MRGHRHGGEGLVDLEEVDIGDRPADPFEQTLNGMNGGRCEPLGVLAECGRADDPRLRHKPELLATRLGGQQERRGAVVDARGIAGGDSSLGIEGRLQGAELRLVEPVRAFVSRHEGRLAASADPDGNDLIVEHSLLDRLAGAGVAADGEIVLRAAGELEFTGAAVAVDAHGLAAVDIPEAVVDHRVDQLGIAHAVALAGLGEQVGGAAHALHAAGDDQPGVAQADRLIGEHDGLEPRAADLVDRRGTDRRWQPREDRRLPRGVLTDPGGDDVAHDHLVDPIGPEDRRVRGGP